MERIGGHPQTPVRGAPLHPYHSLAVQDLGLIPYLDAWQLQAELVQARTLGTIPDTLLLLEHPHTFTCGRGGGRGHILATPEELAGQGVTVLDVDRGGDVTYHGPGQLVAYPILNLAQHSLGRNLHGYVRLLERVIISTVAHFGISAYTLQGLSGVWCRHKGEDAKIAAIGIKVDGRLITSHGIALNVAPDLRYFGLIVPCGITDKDVTSMAELLPIAPPMSEVKAVFARCFVAAFGHSAV